MPNKTQLSDKDLMRPGDTVLMIKQRDPKRNGFYIVGTDDLTPPSVVGTIHRAMASMKERPKKKLSKRQIKTICGYFGVNPSVFGIREKQKRRQ